LKQGGGRSGAEELRGTAVQEQVREGAGRFAPGNSIHQPDRIEFYEKIVGAGKWQLDTCKNGLKLDFVSQPERYCEKNNKSAEQHMGIVQEKVKEWVDGGFVEKLTVQPWCVNPLSVAVKYDPVTDKTKFRPVIDLSRHVNKHVQDMKVKLDDLSVSEDLVAPGDFMASFDLENQFFHVRLDPAYRKFFGFALPGEDGEVQYFQFKVMAYGYRPAVGVVTRLLQPVKAYLHKLGIKVSLYVDDGRVTATSERLAMEQLSTALQVIQSCGWNVQWAKTSTAAEQVHLHLGFFTDSINMCYFFPQQKQQVVLEQLQKVLAEADVGLALAARDLAKLLGRLNSMRRSHGNIVGVMSRSSQHQLGCTVMDQGWESSLQLGVDARGELLFLLQHLQEYNGQHITSAAARSHVVSLVQRDRELELVQQSDVQLPNLFVSDASDSHAFVYKADGLFQYVLDVEFSPEQASASSGLRELLAVRFALSRDPEQFREFRGGRIYWQTDSRNCYLFLKKGSRIPAIQSEAALIKKMERELGVTIEPVWTPRTQARIILADLGSKLSASTDEWGVHREDLSRLFAEWDFRPDVDIMAAGNNAVCKKFFSVLPQVSSAGLNVFCQKLEVGKKYCGHLH
jgi:hypothetical protein